MNAAVGGKGHIGAVPGSGQPDIGQPALLFERCEPVLLHCPLVREQTLLPARQENRVEFEPLGAVQCHQIDHVAAGLGGVVHHQTDMLEKAAEILEFGHRDDQLLEVFEPASRVR